MEADAFTRVLEQLAPGAVTGSTPHAQAVATVKASRLNLGQHIDLMRAFGRLRGEVRPSPPHTCETIVSRPHSPPPPSGFARDAPATKRGPRMPGSTSKGGCNMLLQALPYLWALAVSFLLVGRFARKWWRDQ